MKALNPLARAYRPTLLALAHVSVEGVSVTILRGRYVCPTCTAAGKVTLPVCLFEPDMADQLRRTWHHELQHARDCLDGIDLPLEEMERRARRAEFAP